ncbi:DUF2972 domain-containing protein [Helicobacter sp. MIT 21-1697]|uniref:DUF2972 domain-containing protein n=1 Tax=Helicobacter sp. MIT 21-1697 TaxID=2993733 RepID=UPI00224ADA99|nr:DUF2972 domain-containing protein [Helicobacter sp. MIT 21-1697]MCX2716495.1 DUF2972 domain-containing protein [Helicobacter sp. MIT 21-1697]
MQYGAYNPHTQESYFSHSPCLDKIESYIAKAQKQDEFHSWFILNELLTSLPHITQKHYVDMSEITKDRAFETMKRLSHIFGFETPKEVDKHLFEEQAYAHLYFILPLHLCLVLQDCQITLTLAKNAKDIDITDKIMPPSYQNNPDLENCKVYVKTHKEVQMIQSHFEMIQRELIATLEALLHIVVTKKQQALSEKDILEYFASHPQIAKNFKALCDKDLQDLKRERADIIESWTHYQAFESLCEKLP